MCLQAGELSASFADCTTARGKEQRGQGMPCHVFQSISRLHVQYKSATHCRGTTEKGKGGRHPTIPEGACSPVRPAPISRPERRSHFRCEGSILLALASFLLAFLLLRPSFAAAFSCSGLLSLRPSLAPAFSRSGLLLLRPSFAPVLSFPGRLQGFQVAGSGSSSASAAVLPHLPPRHHSTVLTPDGRRHVEESSRARSTTGAERRMGKTRGESRKQRREIDWLYTVLD